jgi:hypothetical protein
MHEIWLSTPAPRGNIKINFKKFWVQSLTKLKVCLINKIKLSAGIIIG